MLDEIAFFFYGRAFARRHADHAFASATLRAERAHGRALDKPAVSDADDAAFIRDEIFHVNVALISDELSQPWRAMFIFELAQFLFDDREEDRKSTRLNSSHILLSRIPS